VASRWETRSYNTWWHHIHFEAAGGYLLVSRKFRDLIDQGLALHEWAEDWVPNHFILTPRLLPLEPAPGGRPLPRGIDPTSPQLLLRQGQDTLAIFQQEGNGLAVLDCGKGTWRELALVVEDRQGRRPYGRIDGRVLNILRDPVGEGLALLAGGSLATFTLGKTEAVL